MPEAKTQPTTADVDAHLTSRAANDEQLADCQVLSALMQRITGQPPVLWGPSIVGFDRYRYRLSGGKTGESCVTGFAIRGRELVIYLVAEGDDQSRRLAALGRHKMGKSCLYVRRLAEVDLQVLEQLVHASVAEIRRRHAADA